LQRGRMRGSAGFTRRKERRLAGEEASLDRAARRQEESRTARRVTRRQRCTTLVARRKADRVSFEPKGPFVRRRAGAGHEKDHLSGTDHESRRGSDLVTRQQTSRVYSAARNRIQTAAHS